MRTIVKAAAERKDWQIKFGKWFDRDDAISKASAAVTIPNGNIQADTSPLRAYHIGWSGTDVTLWLENGTVGNKYKVDVLVEGTDAPAGLSQGRKEVYSFYVEIK